MLRTPLITIILVSFIVTGTIGPMPVNAQEIRLPKPGVMVHLSPPINPSMLKGIKVNPDNPFRFEFVLDTGDENVNRRGLIHQTQAEGMMNHAPTDFKSESVKLIKYFLASLTIPEGDLWVNLSPYEKNRMVPESFGQTEMGRDLLAQDYMLKQITASLIYPEDEVGKRFWKRIYEESAKKYGTTNIPVNTFNKVWIVPEKAVIYENAKAGTAYVVESRLKVMLECDYLAMDKNIVGATHRGRPLPGQAQGPAPTETNNIGSQIIREIVISELTKEINYGANFAQLRQVYSSLILATWYKKKIKDSILSQVYADKNKIEGIKYAMPTRGHALNQNNKSVSPSSLLSNKALDVKATQMNEPNDVESIYQRYLQAFKKGVYNYIKQDIDPATQQAVPRKYFSGGMALAMNVTNLGSTELRTVDRMDFAQINQDNLRIISSEFTSVNSVLSNQAMKAGESSAVSPDPLKTPARSSFVIEDSPDFKQRYLGAANNHDRIALLKEEYGLRDVEIEVSSIRGGFGVTRGTGLLQKAGDHKYTLTLYGVEGDYEAYLLFHEFMHAYFEEKGLRFNWDSQGAEADNFIFQIKNMLLDYMIEQENKRRFEDQFQDITQDMRDYNLRGVLKDRAIFPSSLIVLALNGKLVTNLYPALSACYSQSFIGKIVKIPYYDELVKEFDKLSVSSSVSDWQNGFMNVYKIMVDSDVKMQANKLVVNIQKLKKVIMNINGNLEMLIQTVQRTMAEQIKPEQQTMPDQIWDALVSELDNSKWPDDFRIILKYHLDAQKRKLNVKSLFDTLRKFHIGPTVNIIYMLNGIFENANLSVRIYNDEQRKIQKVNDDYGFLENLDFAMLETIEGSAQLFKKSDQAMKAEELSAVSPDLQNIFGKPVNEDLPEEIANLPADQSSTRGTLTKRPFGEKTIEQERLELEMLVGVESLEPQVAWAVQMLTIKGYGSKSSGFYYEHPSQIHGGTMERHSIEGFSRSLSPEEIRIIESVPGAKYDVSKNGIFVDSKGKTLKEVKAVFDEIARRLPDHGAQNREQFLMFQQVLGAPNRHFIIKINATDGYQDREIYVNRFVRHLKKFKLTMTTDVISLWETIIGQQEGASQIEVVQGVFKDAIVNGKALVIAGDSLKRFDFSIQDLIKSVLSQQGETVAFNHETLKVHPGFRLVFLLDDSLAKKLMEELERSFLQFNYPVTSQKVDSALPAEHRNGTDNLVLEFERELTEAWRAIPLFYDTEFTDNQPWIMDHRTLWDDVLKVASKHQLLAHGTLNSYYQSNGIGISPLNLHWAMLGIMLEGSVRFGELGNFSSNIGIDDMYKNAARFGPYYVLFRPGSGVPGEKQFKFREHPSKEEDHLIYLVPEENARKFFELGLIKAKERGFITPAQEQIVRSKILTYAEFVASDSQIEDIIRGRVPARRTGNDAQTAKDTDRVMKTEELSAVSPDYKHIALGTVVPPGDAAMRVGKALTNKGGIDFTATKTPLEVHNAGEGIKFQLDPAMLQQLQNAPGFVPVIINIEPMINLREFLGINQQQTTSISA